VQRGVRQREHLPVAPRSAGLDLVAATGGLARDALGLRRGPGAAEARRREVRRQQERERGRRRLGIGEVRPEAPRQRPGRSHSVPGEPQPPAQVEVVDGGLQVRVVAGHEVERAVADDERLGGDEQLERATLRS
jgi:hypothetical protein